MANSQPDGKDVARSDDALVKYLAESTDLSPNQAKELIRRHGNDRVRLLEAARTFKAEC